MAELPPPVREEEFRAVNTDNREQIESYFEPFRERLHTFLNETSCLRDIQRIRSRKNPQITHNLAFRRLNTEAYHWYTHSYGGRSEAQFNIGLFPNYLRVGLGFEFTKGGRQSDEGVRAVWEAYDRFTAAIRRDQWTFDRCVLDNSLMIEWAPEGPSNLQTVTQGLSEWLLEPPQDPRWIFVGRLLYRENDAEILEDAVRLREVMESTFRCLRPFWEQTQTPAV